MEVFSVVGCVAVVERGGLPEAARVEMRGAAVGRLLELRAAGRLTAGHVRVAAGALGVSERTVWRWLAAPGTAPGVVPGARLARADRFVVTDEVRALLALWGGNVAAVQRELAERAVGQSPPGIAPSLTTLHRAIRRDLSAGERAGLAGGERAARKHDVFLARPRGWRNEVWEADHVQAPVLVEVEGVARRPWVTWFVDCATNTVMGVAVTPGSPSRESVLAALRAAVLREEPFGPQGGLPEKVRVDRGKDFLSRTVAAAFGALVVEVEDLPAYTPHLKGTVEGLNRAVESMFLAALPGYVRQPRPGRRPGRPKNEALLGFEDFTARLLGWVEWWNTVHQPGPLGGKTPLGAWEADPTPVREVSPEELWTFTLEDDGRIRVVSTRGVRFRRRDYVGPWMTGLAGTGVRVRFMPHHDHRIEVFDAATGRYLGPATVADEASPEQITAVRTARAARSRRLRKDLAAAQRERYAAVTRPGKPERVDAVSTMEAAAELAVADRADLSRLALPDLIPPAAPPSDWRTPASLAARTRPKPSPAPDDNESGGRPQAGVTSDGEGAAGGGVR
ncbi:Mu transposase C-terminal domain-containing protein [Streptomyces sp. NPDC048606]|uniref:Mu transposase C-terminal domain-containing protein n=1 Tax=Streptomyces sp. NPDC048606 TaxID=3154726 RepID=UPI00341A3EC8